MTPALFLDRDGVINIEKNYLYRIDQFEFVDGIFDICNYFQKRGYLIVIITNQSGIARGIYSEDDFEKLTNWMLDRFLEKGIKIHGVEYCPHHPEFDGECKCRKPKPGMILSLAERLDIDLSKSVLVGDKISDIEAGRNSGIALNCLVEINSLSTLIGILEINKKPD